MSASCRRPEPRGIYAPFAWLGFLFQSRTTLNSPWPLEKDVDPVLMMWDDDVRYWYTPAGQNFTSSLLVPHIAYDRNIRHVGILSAPPSPPPSELVNHRFACKETRNIFSFQPWDHKTRLQNTIMILGDGGGGDCLKQKQTRWRTSLIPSTPGNPPAPTTVTWPLYVPPPIQKFTRCLLAAIKRRGGGGSGPAGLLQITSPLILN